tara:strand:- start:2701 stop:3555 length:855 start_codon:yes stop_codon:yes gene_type:complete
MYYYKLKKKKIICIKGKDANQFLQGIITNNINKLKNNRIIYSTLLSPQGKFLHDFFVIKNNIEEIYLDTPEYNYKKLKEKLNLYKLNRKIEINEKKIYSYFLIFGKSINKIFKLSTKLGEYKKINTMIVFNDPRNINLGCKIICNNKNDHNKLIKIIRNYKLKEDFNEYEKQRILNCIPDIKKDNLYNQAYLLQYNFENLNCICWKKGCFIGQEVTVKMKNKGFLKKKLYVIKFLKRKNFFNKEIKYENELIGTITSNYKNIALGLLKKNKIKNLKKEKKLLII